MLKHLLELKLEKAINGEKFYKSCIKWAELNLNKTISFWVYNLTDDVRLAVKYLVKANSTHNTAEEGSFYYKEARQGPPFAPLI